MVCIYNLLKMLVRETMGLGESPDHPVSPVSLFLSLCHLSEVVRYIGKVQMPTYWTKDQVNNEPLSGDAVSLPFQ